MTSGRRPRILAVSNFYPPHHAGGYELGARDILDELRRRGYHVEVLTSTRGVDRPEVAGGVHRVLGLEYAMNHRSRARRLAYVVERELASRRAFDRVCREVRPDLVYAFNLRNVSISMLFRAERLGLPVLYFASDDWLAHWERDLWYRLRHSGKSLDLGRAQFVSEYLKQDAVRAGKAVTGARVVPWGLVTSRYRLRPAGPNRGRLLFAGQLAEHKGLHTAIEALSIVRQRSPRLGAELSLAGRFLDPAYESRIRHRISSLGLEPHVKFLGSLAREELARQFAEHDVFVFASVWEEPFSIVLLEAMLCGLATVATPTGGTPEIARDRENCLLFAKEDAEACAERILELHERPALADTLRATAQRVVRDGYQLSTMVDRLEPDLRMPG